MAETLFNAVGARLESLIPRFGLGHRGPQVFDAYRLICGESLALPVGEQRPEMCRINRDGTAIQFSLALSRSGPAALQFLGEAGAPGLSGADRIARGRDAIRAVTSLIGADRELAAVSDLLEQIAPRDASPRAEAGDGAFWIGVSFPPAGAPALTIYINAGLGNTTDSWGRARVLATLLGGLAAWDRTLSQVRGCMTPVGMAVTLSAGRPPGGKVYLYAYGLDYDYCGRVLTTASGDPAWRALYDRYIEAMIGEDRQYPARSSVCSLDFEPGSTPNVKFEFCAHCAYSSEAEAAGRCLAWMGHEGLDGDLYRDTIHLLAPGRPLDEVTPPQVHAYMGVGLRHGTAYSTFYLNPGPGLAVRPF